MVIFNVTISRKVATDTGVMEIEAASAEEAQAAAENAVATNAPIEWLASSHQDITCDVEEMPQEAQGETAGAGAGDEGGEDTQASHGHRGGGHGRGRR